jgi:hypothetical protein
VSRSSYGGSGQAPSWAEFSQDGAADGLRPGPWLTALADEAVANLDRLDEGQLLGVGSAARRLAARAGYLELMAVAEFARRRDAQLEASRARGDRVRSRDGEYPAEELGFEMNATAYSAGLLIDLARNVAGRLPSTRAGMEAGLIDRDRARVISNATLHLPDDKAAVADEVLAPAAAELRLADLQRKAARLEARLDPEGVRARKDERKRDRRVELRREDSGAASLAGRELDPAEALTGKASIDAEAARLRNAGLPGTLGQIRAMILMDRIHQRSSWDRLGGQPTQEPEPGPGTESEPGEDRGQDPSPEAGHPADPPRDDPGQNRSRDGRFPDDDADDDDADGIEEDEDEGRPGGRPPTGPPPGRGQPGRDGPADPRAGRTAGFLAGLNAVPEPIARGTCDHAHREDRYTPSRKLKHLIRARAARCCAPGCGAQAITGQIDHTIPYPAGKPASTTSAPRANATTTPSTRQAGNSSRPSQASCAGPRPRAGPTPPAPPNTKNKGIARRRPPVTEGARCGRHG